MQYDNIYLFRILYSDKNGFEEEYKTYSDNDNVYSLENLPETTYFIEVYLLKKDFKDIQGEDTVGNYLIGTPLKIEDLEKEIKTVAATSPDSKYLQDLKGWHYEIETLRYPHVIFRIQGKLVCLNKFMYPGKVIGVIKDGKIVAGDFQNEQTNDKYDNDNYIDLE